MAKALIKRGAKRTSRADFLGKSTAAPLSGRSGPVYRRKKRQIQEPISARNMR